ncbi:MAG TPA: hypothetical protein PKA27_10010 [Fimbriimonadaceae bacterium]|nr:hypothetical protein [Fimbriimonadaceae bacterium]
MAEKKSFLLRISPELWEDLQRLADTEMRSVNAQIEFMLRQAVRQRIRRDDDPDAKKEAP